VRGLQGQGTPLLPFDMVVFNHMSRNHLAARVPRRAACIFSRAPTLIQECETGGTRAVDYSRRHLEDTPEIHDRAGRPLVYS
jgi:xylulose-5-phosphate/fructose-6-phosphate phosphoketolase